MMANQQALAAETGVRQQEHLEARVNSDVKVRLQWAADLQGRSLSEFVIASAQQEAERVIHEHEVMTLSAEDSRAVVEALLRPPAPNETLRAAAADYLEALATGELRSS